LQSDGKEAKAVDLDKPLSNDERKLIVRWALNTEQADAEYMLQMIRERFDRCMSACSLLSIWQML
jgi:hypothetical protein